jgi:hypothetical protein
VQFEDVDGVPMGGEIRGFTLDARAQTLMLRDEMAGGSAPLDERGASGAPVLIKLGATKVAIGVLRRIEPDPERPGHAIGAATFAVPAGELLRKWADLIPAENPFKPPLRPFDSDDASRFYGRARAISALRDVLAGPGTRHVTVIGATGTGKSSLVRAGLIGQRERRRDDPASLDWRRVCVVDSYDGTCVEELASFGESVGDGPALLVFDQFEKILRGGEADEVRRRLLVLLDRHLALTVIFLVRTDHLGEFEENAKQWYAFLYDGIRREIKMDVSREELREMCLEPASAAGITFEPGLVNTIVEALFEAHSKDTGDISVAEAPPTILPLLGMTLWWLTERLGRAREITQQMYVEIGGVRGALALWANEVFDNAVTLLRELDSGDSRGDESERILDRVLLRLVKVGEHDGTPATREFVPREELRCVTDPPAKAESALSSLKDAGVVYTIGEGKNTAFALMHDAIIKLWPRLRRLVESAEATLRWKARSFKGEYEEWRASDGTSGQLRGSQLQLAQEMANRTPEAFSDAELHYLREQRRTATREARRRIAGRIAAGAALVALITVVVVVAAFLTHRSDSTTRAEVQAAGNLKAAARGLEQSNPTLAQALLLEAYRQRPNDESGRNALAEAVSVAPGLTASGTSPGGGTAMPNLSQVIAPPDFGSHCASVTTPADGSIEEQQYCGADGLGQFAASPGSRMVAEVWGTPNGLRVATWRSRAEQPLWTASLVSRRPTHGATVEPGAVAVADDGTVAILDAGQLVILTGGKPQRVAIPSGLGNLSHAQVQIGATARALLILIPLPAPSQPKLYQPTLNAVAVLRRGARFVVGAHWSAGPASPIIAPDDRSALQVDTQGVERIDLATRERSTVTKGPKGLATDGEQSALSPSGRLLAIAQLTGNAVTEIDLTTGAESSLPVAHSDSFADKLTVDDHGNLFLGGSETWDYYSAHWSKAVIEQFPLQGQLAAPPALAPGGTLAAVSTITSVSNARVYVLDLRTGAVLGGISGPNLDPLVGWSPSGALTVTQTDRHIESVRRSVASVYGTMSQGEPTGSVELFRVPPRTAEVDPNGAIYVGPVAGQRGELGVYDTSTRRLVQTIRTGALGRQLEPIGFSSSGSALAIRGGNRVAVVSELLSANPRITYGPTLSTSSVPAVLTAPGVAPTVLSATGTIAATALGPGKVGLTDTRSGAQTTVSVTGSEDLRSMAVSDSRLAVSDMSDDTTIFNVGGAEWLQLAPPPSSSSEGFGIPGDAVGFSPSGSDLVFASSSSLSLFSLNRAAWIASLCAGSPALTADQYAQYAGGSTEKPLCQ